MPTLTGVRLYGPKDTDANWKKNNPSITAGEFIVVTDSKYKFKIATTNAKYNDITFPVAEKATKLETARKIGNASFNGTADITLAQIGAAATSHTHTKSQITDFPTSLKNPTAITIKFNSGTTEGTNLFTYDGSTAKTLNITPSSIGLGNVDNTADSNKTVLASTYALKLRTYKTGSTSETYGDQYPLFAQWDAKNNLRLVCSGYTVATNYADSAGSVAWGNISGKPSTFTPSSHTHSYLPLSGGTVTGNTTFNNGVTIKEAGLELYYTTPFIDFHYKNDSSDHTCRIIELEKGKLNVNGTVCSDDGSLWCTSFSTDGGGTFGGDLSACRGLYLKHAKTSLYLYNDNGGFVIMHTGADGNSTWPVIWSFASSDLYFGGNLRVSGTGKFPNGIYGGAQSTFYVNSGGGCTAASFTTDGAGTFGKGVNARLESTFSAGSYTDPLPGVSCGIKVSGIASAHRFYVKGRSTSWLAGAQPGGAGFECVNEPDTKALIPGWRVRSADGAWVGASYALDPGFRIYYCTAARLSANNSNTTDATFTFGTSGVMYAKSFSQTSDERRKDVIEKLDTVLPDRHKKFFMDIKPFTFKWNDNPENLFTHYGVGAQSLYRSAKDLGFTDDELGFIHKGKDLPDGTNIPWSVTYEELIPLNIKVTQDHERELEEQKKEIEQLKEENKNLSDCIKFLEKENQKILDMLSELLKK